MAGGLEVSIHILCFRRLVIRKICISLDYKSYQTLRQVSNSTRIAVDESVNGLITCEMLVNVFSISDNMLMFVLFDMLHRFIWKRHFINALLVLKISMCSFTETSCDLRISLTDSEMRRLLYLLKPIVHKSTFNTVEFCNATSAQIRMSLDVLNGKLIRSVDFRQELANPGPSYYSSALDFIEIFIPNDGYYVFKQLTQDYIDFIAQVAKYVKEISMFLHENIKLDMAPMIKRIVREKCNNLTLRGFFLQISQASAESIIQELSHLEKQCKLSVNVNADLTVVQIGQFSVKVHNIQEIRFINIDTI